MKYLFALFFSLFITACSVKTYKHTEEKLIIIKSAKFKFADLGYIRHTKKSVELELFIAGRAVKKIDINHLICVDEGCMSKSSFNKEFLSAYYPDDILQDIILGDKIYNSKNTIKTDDGFTQKINSDKVNIYYKVTNKLIFFKDKKNKIIFKIKEIN